MSLYPQTFRALTLCTLILCLFLSGCGKPKKVYPVPEDGVSRFPTGEALEVGDIILARSYGLVGAMFANYSQSGQNDEVKGNFSHGAMVYRDRCGRLMMLNYRPTGMETCTPEEFFTRYNRLALIRYKGDFNAARTPEYVQGGEGLRGKEALSAASISWLDRNEACRVPPDYKLDHYDSSAMFCIELTSTVYRDCGLPDPFHKADRTSEDPVLRMANELFKAGVEEIRSPSSVLSNPEYERVSDWLRPEFDLREEAVNEEIIRVLVGDIKQGYRPMRPTVMGRFQLRQIFTAYHVMTTAMFWRPKQDLPSYVDGEVAQNAYMLYCYAARSKTIAKKRMYEETRAAYGESAENQATLEAVRRIVREECALERDTYLSLRGRCATSCGKNATTKRRSAQSRIQAITQQQDCVGTCANSF